MIAIRTLSDHHVVRELIFRDLPIRIGRGAENDFVLSDSTISMGHAIVERNEEGAIVLRDLQSRNGIRIGEEQVNVVPIQGAVHCFIGMVEVEIEEFTREITREVSVQEWDRFNRRRTFRHHARYILIGAAGWLTLILMEAEYWSPWKEGRYVIFLWNLLGAIIALPIFGFVHLMMLRAVGRKVRIADTFEAMSKVIWLLPLLTIVSSGVYYVLPSNIRTFVELVFGGILFVWGVIYLADLRRSVRTKRFRIAWGISAALIFVGLFGAEVASDRQKGAPQTDYLVLPPVLGSSGLSISLETYLNQIEASARRTDERAEERRKKRGEDK